MPATAARTVKAKKEPRFVDTNILVCSFDSSDPKKQKVARQLLDELMESDRLRLSTQVLQELFVTLTHKVKTPCSSQRALEVMEDLAAWPVSLIDFKAIKTAIGLAGEAKISFWDALVVVAAADAGATVLYTEDLTDGLEILGVRITNPFKG